MNNEKMVLSTSDEAATFKTDISGWVSRLGHFYGKDEHTARYDGCTHVPCAECGKPTERGWTKCSDCRNKKRDDKFKTFEKKEWDGKTPLALWDGDEYFFDADDLYDWCEEHECTPQDIQLVLCRPVYARIIEDDFYYDDLPEDMNLDDVAPELASKIDELNKYIEESKPILSWMPSEIAAIIKQEENKG